MARYLAKCAGKQQHTTRAEAERHQANLVAMGQYKPGKSNVYKCGVCGAFHVGGTGSINRGTTRRPREKNRPKPFNPSQ